MTRESKESALLRRIIDHYTLSGDFNGLPVDNKRNPEVVPAATRLVRKGLVEIVTGEDFANPHVRPWHSRRTIEQQVADLRRAPSSPHALCLYPTAAGLVGRTDPLLFEGRPYNRRLLDGGTTLELAYFRMDVLETYREDPRFDFKFYDFGFDFNISDELYRDPNEPNAEKVSMRHGGFAYNLERALIERTVCVFLCDLKDFTPEIQQRWRTFELAPPAKYEPHPVWWGAQMGHWPDGPGPFARFFGERRALNDIFVAAFGHALFKTGEPPREFGWLLRPTGREYGRFVLELDKLLSDDLNDKALSAARAQEFGADGAKLGTLNRFESLLERAKVPEGDRKRVLRPLRRVRTERQKPAHKNTSNHANPAIIAEQVDLINDVVESLSVLRIFFHGHPKAKAIAIEAFLDSETSYRM